MQNMKNKWEGLKYNPLEQLNKKQEVSLKFDFSTAKCDIIYMCRVNICAFFVS